MQRANAEYPPPYVDERYTEDYRRQACDPFWLSSCLIANAVKEADGARRLALFAGRIPHSRYSVAAAVLRHATDEAKHARVFLQLLHAVFPEAEISDRLKTDLETHLPQPPMTVVVADRPPYTMEQMIDEISQINIGEIRTRINQLILRPMLLAHAPEEHQIRVRRTIDNLLRDEQTHIAYTARILEDSSQGGYKGFFENMYRHRFRRFNDRTIRELDGSSVDL